MLVFAVIRAANLFYVGSTNIPLDPNNPHKVVPSKQLSFVTEPEEKRKIIGDVFMKVRKLQDRLPDAQEYV